MRSYTNKQNEVIEVNKEHLDMAIKIKQELQKSSPSRKCNWKLHKQCMEKEGFVDSDTSESYRCMIKAHQKQVGKLPKAEKYADMVADSKLESIKELVGEIAYEKRENQHVLKELNKVKRDVIDFTLIAEQIGSAFKTYDFSELKFKYKPIAESNKKMFIGLADLHIGAIVDNELNTYNYEVAKDRMQQYLNKLITEIKDNDISKVFVGGLGDFVEMPYMHNLAYTSEFTLSQQIVKATDLVVKFLYKLSKYVEVEYAGISGNHDRLSENKNVTLDGDTAVKAINYGIQSFIENAEVERITYVEAKDYEHSLEINGVKIKMIHGDLDKITDTIIAKHSDLDRIDYDIIVMGHYHHYRVMELGINKYAVIFGSLKGADNYGMKTRRVSSASQGYILIGENKEIEIKQFKF